MDIMNYASKRRHGRHRLRRRGRGGEHDVEIVFLRERGRQLPVEHPEHHIPRVAQRLYADREV